MNKKVKLISSIAVIALAIIIGFAKGGRRRKQIDYVTSNIDYANTLQTAYRQYSVMEKVFDMYAEKVPDTAAGLKNKLPDVQSAANDAEALLRSFTELVPPDGFSAQHNRLVEAANKEMQMHEILVRIYSDNLPLNAQATGMEYRKIKSDIPPGERFSDLGEVLYDEFYNKYIV